MITFLSFCLPLLFIYNYLGFQCKKIIMCDMMKGQKPAPASNFVWVKRRSHSSDKMLIPYSSWVTSLDSPPCVWTLLMF